MPVRIAEAIWTGNLAEGRGTMKFGDVAAPFTRSSRFESGDGSNPEELLGAAHAGCFSMFLSAVLSKAGFPPRRIHTAARVFLGDGPAITRIELETDADVPDVDEQRFQAAVEESKKNCPISKALAVGDITARARLVNR